VTGYYYTHFHNNTLHSFYVLVLKKQSWLLS